MWSTLFHLGPPHMHPPISQFPWSAESPRGHSPESPGAWWPMSGSTWAQVQEFGVIGAGMGPRHLHFKLYGRFHCLAETRPPQQCSCTRGSHGLRRGLWEGAPKVFPHDSVAEVGGEPPPWTLSTVPLGVNGPRTLWKGLLPSLWGGVGPWGQRGREATGEEATFSARPSRSPSQGSVNHTRDERKTSRRLMTRAPDTHSGDPATSDPAGC